MSGKRITLSSMFYGDEPTAYGPLRAIDFPIARSLPGLWLGSELLQAVGSQGSAPPVRPPVPVLSTQNWRASLRICVSGSTQQALPMLFNASKKG